MTKFVSKGKLSPKKSIVKRSMNTRNSRMVPTNVDKNGDNNGGKNNDKNDKTDNTHDVWNVSNTTHDCCRC